MSVLLRHRLGGSGAGGRAARRAAPALLVTLAGALLGAALLGLTPALLSAAPPPDGLPDAGVLVGGGVLVLRLALDLAGVAVVGLLALPLLVPRSVGVPEHVRGHTVAACLAWAVFALLGLWWRTAEVTALPPDAVGPDDVLRFVQAFGAGRGLVLAAACAAVLAVGLALSRRLPERLPELWVGLALLGVLAGPVSGHASDHPAHGPAVLLVAVHVIAAAGWVGGLAALLIGFGRQPALLLAALPRFSALAATAIATVALTGVLNALVRWPADPAGVGAGYVLLLVAKTLALLGLAAFGWRARKRLSRRAEPWSRGALVGWLAAELVLMAFALGLAAALAQTPTG